MSSWLKQLENVLEKVDKKTAETIGTTPKKVKEEPKDEDIFKFLNEPIREAKLKQEETRKAKQQKNRPESQQITKNVTNPPASNMKILIPTTAPPAVSVETISVKETLGTEHEKNTQENMTKGAETKRENEESSESNISTPPTNEEFNLNPIDTENTVETKNNEGTNIVTIESPRRSKDEELEEDYAKRESLLQLENKLLRSEIVSLNQQLSSNTAKSKQIQQEYERASINLAEMQKNLLEKEKKLAIMKANEEEFDVALGSKNAQITALQVRLEEAQQDIKSLQEKLRVEENAIKKIAQEKDSTTAVHEQSKQMLKAKVEQLEKALAEEESKHIVTKQVHLEKQRELEANVAELTNALATAQRHLQDKSSDLLRTASQLKEIQENSKSLKQELQEYKQRATKVLQEKEKFIKELTSAPSSNRTPVLEATPDLERMREELQKVTEEKHSQELLVEELKYRLAEQESQATEDIKGLENQIRQIEDLLEKEKKSVQATQIELAYKTHENITLKDELEKEKETYYSSLKSREETLQKLQRQIAAKSSSVSSQEELENRLQTLTDHLIQKQSQLENIMSERQYLQLQLENALQNQKATEDKHTIIIEDRLPKRRGSDSLQGARQRSLASIVEGSSYHLDSPITQKVVGAANFIDSVSTITGTYLGHYPLIRLTAILYALLLHLWVMYVFFTFNPEVHPDP